MGVETVDGGHLDRSKGFTNILSKHGQDWRLGLSMATLANPTRFFQRTL